MSYELYEWEARFRQEGLTYVLRQELLALLRPYANLKSPFRLPELVETAPATSNEPTHIKDVVDWEIVLGTSDVHERLQTLRSNPRWDDALLELLPNFTSLLADALDLMRELDGADELSDGSYWHQPSIGEHSQNQKFRDWTALIELTRDAFLVTSRTNSSKARAEVERWLNYHYPVFRRLAFYAATETDVFTPHVSLQWLLAAESWWLWSVETERESIRLLVKLAKMLSTKDSAPLLAAILRGPPRRMFTSEIDADKFRRISEREIWLRLTKFQSASATPLSGEAAERLASISHSYPDWKAADDESDEFPVWMGEPEDWYKTEVSPKEPAKLQAWLLVQRTEIGNDDWSDRCKDDFSTAVSALVALGQNGQWPADRWRTALQVWSDASFVLESWQQLKQPLGAIDHDSMKAIAQPLSWWLEAVGKVFTEDEPQFHKLIRQLVETQTNEPFDAASDPIFRAINHPVGQATNAVFRWWYRQDLEDNAGLKVEPRGIFTLLCNEQIESYRHARVVMAANIIALFRVDREWTERSLLPRFDWSANLDEARAVWSGFLWAPRLYDPLFAAIKAPFLETARRYKALGELGPRFANLLTLVALEAPEPFTKKELASATAQLPADGLDRCAISLVQGLDSAADKRAEYWTNRVRPYLREIWPKSNDALSRSIANSFARLGMKAGDAFPDAVATLKPWLSNIPQGDVLLRQFRETGLAKRFPEDALTFLDAVLREDSFFLVDGLSDSLAEIRLERPNLENDPRFARLTRYARQLGG